MNIINPYRFGGSSTTLLDGLVSWWELEESSSTRVDSHGSTNLTDVNTVGSATGKIGTAAHFTGANNEELTNTAAPSGMWGGDKDWTISCWAYHDSTTFQVLMCLDGTLTSSSLTLDWMLYLVASKYRFYTSDGGFDYVEATTFGNISTATWNHIVAWHDSAAGSINICINDGATDTNSSIGTPTHKAGHDDIRLGRYGNSTSTMNGRIDEAAIWDRLLTADEITELYNSGDGIGYPG